MKKYISIIIPAVLIILAIYTVNYVLNPERQIKNFVNENSVPDVLKFGGKNNV